MRVILKKHYLMHLCQIWKSVCKNLPTYIIVKPGHIITFQFFFYIDQKAFNSYFKLQKNIQSLVYLTLQLIYLHGSVMVNNITAK